MFVKWIFTFGYVWVWKSLCGSTLKNSRISRNARQLNIQCAAVPLEDATVNFLSLLPLIREQKHGPNCFPQTITKKGSCLGKLCSWEDTMVGIILASRSNVSPGKNNLVQWCLTYFAALNKTRISKQAEGTLASLPREWEECWEWTAADLREKNQECVYVRVQLWTSMKHLCQNFSRLTPKTLWKQVSLSNLLEI